MANVRFVLGAEADLATGQELGQLRDDMAKGFGLLSKRDPRPLFTTNPGSAIAVAGVPTVINLGGPASGRLWDVRQLIAMGADDHTIGLTRNTSGAGAAGGSITLPPGASLAEFTVTAATVGAAVSGVVTVGPAAGGITQQYQITMGPGGTYLNVDYTEPLAAQDPGTSIVVTMPAIVGGSAWTISTQELYPVAWYVAPGDVNAAMLTQVLVPGLPASFLPMVATPASARSIFVHYGEKLIAKAYGVPAGAQVTAVARVADWSDLVPEGRQV